MPQFGLKQAQPAAPAQVADLPPLPWDLPGAEAAQLTFEVDVEATLDLLPAQLSRPVPPYARLFVARYPDSPVGPFSEALLLLACRYRLQPMQYPAAVVVTSDRAVAAYRAFWGIEARVGDVQLRRDHDAATGTETITATIVAGGPLATARMPGAYAIEPAMVRYDPFISVRLAEAGAEPEVFLFSGAPTVHSARLAKGASVTCQTDAWADPWFRLRSLNMISATFAESDLQRTEPAVQPAPAARG